MFFTANNNIDPRDGGSMDAVAEALDAVVDVDRAITGLVSDRFVAVMAWREQTLLSAAEDRWASPDMVARSMRLELAAALRITEYSSAVMIAHAEALQDRYSLAGVALRDGRITERHAAVLIELLDTVEPELRAGLVSRAVALAEELPLGAFRRELRKLVDAVRAVTLELRHREALTQRRIAVEPATDGMAWLMALMPAVEAHAIYERVTAIAKTVQVADKHAATAEVQKAEREGSVPDDKAQVRTLNQARADVFGDLLIDGMTDHLPPEARGIRASVVVTVPVLALLDESTNAGDPPVVEGIGPIPLSRAKDLCGGAEGWMRVLTHPETGMVLSVGRDRYRPPKSLADLVKWRADRCLAPGCGVPASRCQVDHNLAWEDGGHTGLTNHAPFCQGHHTLKHHGGWQVIQIPGSGGAIQWTSPAGRHYVVKPERRVPVFTAQQPTAEPEPPPF